jgi:hypothetical protein
MRLRSTAAWLAGCISPTAANFAPIKSRVSRLHFVPQRLKPLSFQILTPRLNLRPDELRPTTAESTAESLVLLELGLSEPRLRRGGFAFFRCVVRFVGRDHFFC